MSDSSSRVFSFIQRAKQLTESSKVPPTPSTQPHTQLSPMMNSSNSLKQLPQSLKTDTSKVSLLSKPGTVRVPTPNHLTEHKPSSSQTILPTFHFPESTSKSSRQGTPTNPEVLSSKFKKPEHKSSTSQIFFPSSSSKPPLKGSISRFSSFSNNSKPPTPKISSRSSTPNTSRSFKSPSPIKELFNTSPQSSEVPTKPPHDPVDLDSAIAQLMQIRAGIDEKIKEQQMIELQMIQMINRKLEKVKKSEELYENIETAQSAYKRKFEKFVEKNKAKLTRLEKELLEIEGQNSETKAKFKLSKSSSSCLWFGRASLDFDIKTKGEEELAEVLEEQLYFISNELLSDSPSSSPFKVSWKDLNIALAKKFLIEQSRLSKAETLAANSRREEEKMIDFLEEQLKKAEKSDII